MLIAAIKDWRFASALSGVMVPYVVLRCVNMVNGRLLPSPLVALARTARYLLSIALMICASLHVCECVWILPRQREYLSMDLGRWETGDVND